MLSRLILSRVAAALLTLLGAWTPVIAGDDGIQMINAEGEKALLADPGTDPAGARNADVTIVEFFDYNCPYCKKMTPVFQSLLERDHKVAIVYKDWPILSEGSVYAAKAALAARWQGKYLLAHDALINGPRVSQSDQIDALLGQAGINVETLKADRVKHAADIERLLKRNAEEARALSLRGTPGLVVGRYLVPGILDVDALTQLLKTARQQAGA